MGPETGSIPFSSLVLDVCSQRGVAESLYFFPLYHAPLPS